MIKHSDFPSRNGRLQRVRQPFKRVARDAFKSITSPARKNSLTASAARQRLRNSSTPFNPAPRAAAAMMPAFLPTAYNCSTPNSAARPPDFFHATPRYACRVRPCPRAPRRAGPRTESDANVSNAARIESAFALYASSSTHTPFQFQNLQPHFRWACIPRGRAGFLRGTNPVPRPPPRHKTAFTT